PKGRFFATTRDDLLECAALVRAIRQGDLDRLMIPESPLDVLAQQIVATCAAAQSGDTRVARAPRPRASENDALVSEEASNLSFVNAALQRLDGAVVRADSGAGGAAPHREEWGEDEMFAL